jgi:hypothetical protein
LAERTERYGIERELWAWWQAEETWMRAPRRTSSKHRAGRGQLSLVPEAGTNAYGPHPRRGDGRLDWREARRIVRDERGGVAHRVPVFEPAESLDATERMLHDILGAVRVA